MDCKRFEKTIELLSRAAASRAARQAAEVHLSTCPRCRQVYGTGAQNAEHASGLTDMSRSILAATSGPACPAAEQVLSEAFDVEPDDARTALLRLHTTACPDCRDLEYATRLIRQVLPAMASLDPGEEFTAGVVTATRGIASKRPRRRWTSPAQFWERLVRRPLFAWEAAYAGTLLFALVFLNPFIPVRTYSVQAFVEVRETAVTAVEPAETAARQLARKVADRVADRSAAMEKALGSWTGRAQSLVRGTVAEVRGRLRSSRP